MCENNPRKLFVRVIRNSDVRMNEFPLFSFPFLRIVFMFKIFSLFAKGESQKSVQS